MKYKEEHIVTIEMPMVMLEAIMNLILNVDMPRAVKPEHQREIEKFVDFIQD